MERAAITYISGKRKMAPVDQSSGLTHKDSLRYKLCGAQRRCSHREANLLWILRIFLRAEICTSQDKGNRFFKGITSGAQGSFAVCIQLVRTLHISNNVANTFCVSEPKVNKQAKIFT